MNLPRSKSRWLGAAAVAAASLALVCIAARTSGADAPAGRYLLAAGTVYDTRTLLTWQRASAPGTLTLAQAKAYCANLSTAGGGWRLPSRNELVTLVDLSRPAPLPSIDSKFADTTPVPYWTGTQDAKYPNYSHIVLFDYGEAGRYLDTDAYRVRCVK